MNKIFAFVLLLVFVGCKAPEKPVTKAEALQLHNRLDSCLQRRNGKAFDELFNGTLLARRFKSKNILSDAARSKGIREGLKNANLGNQIIRSLQTNDDSYSLVKHYETNGVQHLLYRLHGNDGLNYHDLELERYKGKVYIADIYIYASGENFSKTLSDLLEYKGESGLNEKKDFQDLLKIKELFTQGRNEEAKKYFDKLDPGFKNQRSVQFMYVMVCSKLDEEIYLKALNQFVSQYPNDANTSLLMIDVYFLRKDYAKANLYVEKLDSIINKDPYLDYYRALITKSLGDIKGATKYLENLCKNMPEFSGGVIELIANYLDIEKYDKARDIINYYRNQKKFDQETLDHVLAIYPGYKE